MNRSRICRLVKLISLLQAGKRHNTDALATECQVSRRTVFRDLDSLREAGIPLVFDPQQERYHIPGSRLLPPTNFTPEEALSLIVLCHDLGDRRNLPFFGPARSAAIKLESGLPPRLRDALRQTADALEIQLPPANPLAGQRPIYDQLVEALGQRRAVRVYYQSLAEDQRIRTRIHPYRLLFSRRSWYLIGRSSLHRATRTFNLGRILDLEVLEDQYQIPRGFSTERYLGNAWHLVPEPGPDREVVVRFGKQVAQNVAEVAWHKTQRLEFHADGTLDFHVTVSGLHEISWWILGYGDRAEVLRPPELRQIIARHVARLAEIYGSEEM
jgi:predicted DNA-binding transcriptional regulator YafY